MSDAFEGYSYDPNNEHDLDAEPGSYEYHDIPSIHALIGESYKKEKSNETN